MFRTDPLRAGSSALALVLIAHVATAAPRGSCTTVLPGPVVGETWTAAASPYCVTGDIFVSGLTIEPGVTVRVADDVRIDALSITATGTPSAPILFTAEDPNVGWKGLRFQSTPPGSTLEHCIIEHANDSGLIVIDSEPVLRDCTIRDSRAVNGGGMKIAMSTAGLLVEGFVVERNESTGNGGGIHAVMGGAPLVLDRCLVRDNTANPAIACGTQTSGGGLYVDGDSVIRNSVFRGNRCNANAGSFHTRSSAGGGVFSSTGLLTVENSRIVDNRAHAQTCGSSATARAWGGGVYVASGSASLTNCIAACNTVTANQVRGGAGLYLGAAAALVNCTIVRNGLTGTTGNTGVHDASGNVTLTNSIVYWNNHEAAQTYGPQLGGAPTAEYCDVQGGILPGTGNLSFNPFLGGDGCGTWDTRILAGSPCIDAGDPASAYDDACSQQSFGTSRNDMGAHGGPLSCDWDAPGNPVRYCVATPNSTGQPALMGWSGSTSIASNDLTLTAEGLPPSTIGIFIFGCNRGETPFGHGNLCLSGSVNRLQAVFASPQGVASRQLDFTALTGARTIRPGDTVDFQFWYRNMLAGPPFFNLTDGLEVPFRQ